MITMTETQWDELKARIDLTLDWVHALAVVGIQTDDRRALTVQESDLRALIAEVDDENTRARYMALAADDQLSLFDGAPV